METIQFIFTVGSADIDDLILNTIGAWLGYLAYKGLLLTPKKNEKTASYPVKGLDINLTFMGGFFYLLTLFILCKW
ncbi:VanZ family protein [Lysinibacillus sp. MHQ-1]|nr:VanZ family protein [Lysinibacillus sp. MHQ-1]